MKDHDLYELSTQLNDLVKSTQQLLSLNTTRYKHFVDGSDRGFNCTYARITARYFHSENELQTLRTQLADLAAQAQVIAALAAKADPADPAQLLDL